MVLRRNDDEYSDEELAALLLEHDPAFREEVLYEMAMLLPVPPRTPVEPKWRLRRERDPEALLDAPAGRIVEADPPARARARETKANKHQGWLWVALLGVGVILFLLAGQTIPASKPAPSCPASRVVCAPTISAAFIDQVLAAYHSPVAGHGQHIYDDGVQYGIDPAFALAFFMHESTFGIAGEAHSSRSIGNLRCIPNALCRDGYAWFGTWDEGIDAWYRLIKDGYVGGAVSSRCPCFTIEQIIPVYAPAADQNDEGAYIQAVEHAVATWRAGQVVVT